jgi:ubiquitin-protein ligase
LSNVRLRRLMADYESVRRLVRRHPRIKVEGVSGNPPDRYLLEIHVRSLRERGTEIEIADTHRVEITLPSSYPRDAPRFRMLTPVFHPNIAPHAVCIGDHWTAGQSLDTLVQRVCEMLAFQAYNIKSPLNGRAAQWVDENPNRLPVDDGEMVLEEQ